MPCFKNYIHAFLVSKWFDSSSQAHLSHPHAHSSRLSTERLRLCFFPANEVPQCPFSGSPSPCMTAEMSSSPAPRFSHGGTELPPSYEDIMKENKL